LADRVSAATPAVIPALGLPPVFDDADLAVAFGASFAAEASAMLLIDNKQLNKNIFFFMNFLLYDV